MKVEIIFRLSACAYVRAERNEIDHGIAQLRGLPTFRPGFLIEKTHYRRTKLC